MQNRQSFTKYLPIALAASAAVLSALIYAGSATAGIEPQPFLTGMVGVIETQTPRLNAVNVGNVVATGDLLILDASGKVVAQTTFVLQPGQAASLTMAAQKVRGLFRGQLNLRGSTGGLVPAVIPSFELADVTTGKTDLLVTGSTVVFSSLHR